MSGRPLPGDSSRLSIGTRLIQPAPALGCHPFGTANLRPGSFLDHKSLWYHNEFKVSIPSNRSVLGIETLTSLWYSVPRLQEPMPRGQRGALYAGRARRGRGGRDKISSLIYEHGRTIMPRNRAVNFNVSLSIS